MVWMAPEAPHTITSIEDPNLEHISADQYPDVEYLIARAATTLSGRFPKLRSLIAPYLTALDPSQVPNLRELNASFSDLDIRLADFPSLRKVYCGLGHWEDASEERRLKGFHYRKGELVQPIRETIRYQLDRLFGKRRGDFASALSEIYGERIRDVIRDIEDEEPGISPEAIVRQIEVANTCPNSAFFREPNIDVLARDVMSGDKSKKWKNLCVGCGYGPEPYQLGMRLMENGVDFQIDGIDINSEVVEMAKSGTSEVSCASLYYAFFEEMAAKGFIIFDERQRKCRLSDELMRRMSFKQHDAINGPAEEQKQYDVAVCNNVLQHLPRHTREVMLINILANLRDGGILALEQNHFSFSGNDEKEWLLPYYKWKRDLARFGLTSRRLGNRYTLGESPVTIFEYRRKKNRFRDGRFAIRGKKAVRMPAA